MAELDPHPGDEPAPGSESPKRSRRSLLKMLGVLAAGAAGGAAVRSERAGAVDGGGLTLGAHNDATGKTTLLTSGALHNDGALVVEAQAADWALEGSSGQIGVLGSGYIGVSGTGDIGGFFSGNLAAISLQPQDTPGSPSSGDYSKGDVLVGADGVMYLCTAAGNPGTWVRVSDTGSRYLPAPQRAYDSRTTVEGKLHPGDGDTATPRTIPIASVVTGVPPDARGVFGTLSIVDPESLIFATVWPEGAWPGTASMLASQGAFISNSFDVGLNSNGSGSIRIAASGATHVIIDIAGYAL